MSCRFGNKLKIQIFGQSHSQKLGAVIEGIPSGMKIDMEEIEKFLRRRQGGNNKYSTPRKEEDEPVIVSGVIDDITCGIPLCVIFNNNNQNSKDYSDIGDMPRPSHSDLNSLVKYGEHRDVRGGGNFSGRMTLPLCFVGALCKQLLAERGIKVQSHIYSIGDVYDVPYDLLETEDNRYRENEFPTNSKAKGQKMIDIIQRVHEEGDSIGGVVECAIVGMPQGAGEPMFQGIENNLSSAMFGIPGIKAIEFGAGFQVATMRGSENNDEYYYKDDEISLKSNNSGGILGGISTGAPIVFRVAIKPTPSISREQNSISIRKKENVKISIKGRHDPCIVPRAVPCVEAMAAITMLDYLL